MYELSELLINYIPQALETNDSDFNIGVLKSLLECNLKEEDLEVINSFVYIIEQKKSGNFLEKLLIFELRNKMLRIVLEKIEQTKVSMEEKQTKIDEDLSKSLNNKDRTGYYRERFDEYEKKDKKVIGVNRLIVTKNGKQVIEAEITYSDGTKIKNIEGLREEDQEFSTSKNIESNFYKEE